ncbi:hypothetical protein BDV26DRAFT_270600 [Aspergillus bertholletiae]|uniref:Uncharacterized protein n=1 Tax=Aspergillus bertholletiae TaxID=1226010 RepID=A0A5N7AXM0_9EURO|nr:hypothetical protein BDV26DRAFT_270600 [Aspergillus bertholletiae]
MELSQSEGGFRSRRSYPSLNHTSLAPLTSRFPIDDDVEHQDYFTPRTDDAEPYHNAHEVPAKTSYLSSYSVPGTPGLLSHSRSGSRARHHQRSKSSTRAHLSDTNLQGQDDVQPFHHQVPKTKRHSYRHQPSDSASRRDAEWMLRAGIALASSTREEKGQSWLAKRESSTSLVDEGNYAVESPGHFNKVTRKSKSGRSTPAASRSRVVSRRGSRPDLAMTSLGMTSARQGDNHGLESPALDVRHFVPDFVDERIRAEMAIIQQEDYTSESDEYSDSEGDIDEQEMQRLTREHGFGLGSWFDRMVEWTVFGVDDWPLSYSNQPVDQVPKNVEWAEPSAANEDDDDDDQVSVSGQTDQTDGASIISDSDVPAVTEKPGDHGGWEDAWWLFGVMRRALL